MLAGGVAHDFNNILTAIGGNLGLIGQHSFLPPDSRELLNRAEAACERARSLAEQLSTFSREGDFATGLRDLSALLRKSVHFALYGGQSRPEFYLPADLWPVYCDESQISQVISNLTMNADQAMAERANAIPTKRIGTPAEFGATCAFLCSQHVGFMIGQNVLLDGGVGNTTM